MAIQTDHRVSSFAAYVMAIHRRAAERHGISIAEAKRELPADNYRREWRNYVVSEFDNGASIPTRLWRSFDDALVYRVLRTPRALKDNALTHDMKTKRQA